jgi:LacI family transcriptional regulator
VLSDTTAIAAVKALEDSGRRVPEDVSVIAIDGLEISAYTMPTLSTMVQPAEEMGRESVRLLKELLGGGAHRHICLEAAFREGKSIRSL